MIDAFYRFLSSLGFNDPLHAPIVHIPIGLVIGALVFFAIALLFKRKHLILTARWTSILAFIFVFPSILLGFFDWIHFYHGVLMPAIRIKMILAAVLLVLIGLGIIIGDEVKQRRTAMALIYALSFLAVVGLGYYGGSLVYGGSIAAERSQDGDAEDSRIGVAAAPSFSERARPEAAGTEPSGRDIFASNCQACHARGGNSIVAALPIRGSKKLARLEEFVSFVRAPAMPDGKLGAMPPFSEDTLEEGQAKALYDFLITEFK